MVQSMVTIGFENCDSREEIKKLSPRIAEKYVCRFTPALWKNKSVGQWITWELDGREKQPQQSRHWHRWAIVWRDRFYVRFPSVFFIFFRGSTISVSDIGSNTLVWALSLSLSLCLLAPLLLFANAKARLQIFVAPTSNRNVTSWHVLPLHLRFEVVVFFYRLLMLPVVALKM